MKGYNYKFAVHPTKNVITLKPTRGTYAKAFLPTLVIWGLLGVAGVALNRRAEQELVFDLQDTSDQD